MLRTLFLLRALLLVCCGSFFVGTSAAAVRLPPGLASIAIGAEVSVLEDAGGHLSLEDVKRREAEFKSLPAQGDAAINFGYSSSVWWLRFTLEAPPPPRDMLLEVAFPTLDRVDFFGPGGEQLSAGDRLPFSMRQVAHRNLVFPVHLADAGPATVWLRVQSEGTVTVPLRLWQAEAFWQDSHTRYAVHALFFGMLLALALYNLLQWAVLRDRAYLTYVLFVAGMVVGQLSLSGMGGEFLWPDWPAWGHLAFPVGFAAAGLSGALFTRDFLETRRTMPRLDGAVVGLAVLFALCMLIPLLASYRLAAILNTLAGASFSLLALLAGIRRWRHGAPGARSFTLAWAMLLLGALVFGLRNINFLPSTFVSFQAMQMGSTLVMLFLSFALADRVNGLQREHDAIQNEVLNSKQQLVGDLHRSVASLEQRVAERTGELDMANAQLREHRRELQDLAHTDALTGLANRLLFDARLQQSMQQVRRGHGQIALLRVELDGFQAINDRYGKAIGAELLRNMSDRLRTAVREVDTVARLDSEQFAIVLTAVASNADAERVAEKLVGNLGAPIRVLGMLLDVNASIGIAQFSGGDISLAELLRRADWAKSAAKQAGSGCYRVFAA
ncbi:MAG: diguanylate cyclase [Burkholderiaceae bacterium]|nr:diguanylate cyclase [Sulfuritalea sp.]MCF8176603.1 diguanylate cyclase [Burkholderiaceae bacterium]MCF8184346.1 diguanylate cyclase [Polynucleobacter sp.]